MSALLSISYAFLPVGSSTHMAFHHLFHWIYWSSWCPLLVSQNTLGHLRGLRLVGVVTSESRASRVPVRVSRDSIDFVRDEMLALIEDVEENRIYLGVVKGSVKKDIAIDGSSLPTNFDPERSLSYTAPLMTCYVEVIGEVVDGSLELNFSIPRPGSRVYIVTGDFNVAMLLRVPEGLHVGFHKFSGMRVSLDPRSLDYHVAVLGATGTGKSRLVKALVEEALAKTDYKVIVFDHTGLDYSDPSRWGGSVNIVDGSRIALTPDVIAEVLADRMGLANEQQRDYMFLAVTLYIARSILAGSMGKSSLASSEYAFKRLLENLDLESVIEGYFKLSRSGSFKWDFKEFLEVLDYCLTLMNAWSSTRVKFKIILHVRVGRRFFENYLNGRSVIVGDVVEDILSGKSRLTIVDLSREVEYEAKKFIVYQFLKEVWDRVLESRGRAGVLAVVDEAHNYACARGCEPSSGIIARIAREGRKWGFGLVLASQRVIDLAPEVRGNINTVFFSRVQSASDYDELKRWIEGLQFIEYTLPLLARREFYLAGLGNTFRKPLLVRVRDVS